MAENSFPSFFLLHVHLFPVMLQLRLCASRAKHSERVTWNQTLIKEHIHLAGSHLDNAVLRRPKGCV